MASKKSSRNGNPHDLLQWAETKGAVLHGIRPKALPCRGIGVVATRGLKAGEVLLSLPKSSLRTMDTIPKSIMQRVPPSMSLHSLLAADVALDKTVHNAPWKAVLPTLTDFEANIPLLWPAELQTLLPKTARDLLERQQARLQRDWDNLERSFPNLTKDEYVYAWLLVNTRTFYYVTPEMEKLPPDDRLALLPLADLLNHADTGCQVSFSSQGYTITADREYLEGEEVCCCYGEHSNDFLLTEYGFVLAENKWDEICLDEEILPQFSRAQEAELDNRGFLGKYFVDAGTVGCHRTQVALRVLCGSKKKWLRFIDTGEDDEPSLQRKVDAMLMRVLERVLEKTRKTLMCVEKSTVGHDGQREILARRWKQIETLVMLAASRLEIH